MNKEKIRRPRVEMDGIMQVGTDEFHTFAAFTHPRGVGYFITVPSAIVTELGIRPRELLQVAIRKISEEACKEAFLGLPSSKRNIKPMIRPVYDTRAYPLPPRQRQKVKRTLCPVCGKVGRLNIVNTHRSIFSKKTKEKKIYSSHNIQMSHCQCDGFKVITIHYISKQRFPEFYGREVLPRLASREVKE